MIIKTKVLVVGGGPSGAIAASVLARSGKEALLLERHPCFEKACGGGVSSVAFAEFDIPVEQAQREVRRVRLISPNNTVAEIDLSPQSLFIVDRGLFDASLRNKAKAHGAELMEGEFAVLERGRRHYSSRILTQTGEIAIQSEFIIAADGVNSKVRKAAGIKPQEAFFTISSRIDGIVSDVCEFWFSTLHAPTFYSWVFPAKNGVSVGTGSRGPKSIKDLFETFKRRRRLNKCSGQSKICRIPAWKGDLYNQGNILFAGDAAGQVMPLSYEGIYYAMKSGEYAAEAVLRGDSGLYKKIWKDSFYKKFILMSKLNSYFLKNDANAEQMVRLHLKAEIQAAAKNLWLLKAPDSLSLRKYIRMFGKILI